MDLFYFLPFLQESEDVDLEEEDVEDDLRLLLPSSSWTCFLLDWSLLEICPEMEAYEVCLLSDLQLLSGGSMTTLGLDILLKSGSRGNRVRF